MELCEICGAAAIPEDVRRVLERVSEELDTGRLEREISGLTDIGTAERCYLALRDALGEDPEGYKMLLCQLTACGRVRESYARAGIGDRVFAATMGCFGRFIGECRERTGMPAFDRGWWTYRQLSMTIFRLGELEYETRVRDGERQVGIHIPSDADLTPERVDESLGLFREFAAEHLPEYASSPLVCGSWLLSPVLEELLDEPSRILAFRRRFRITRFEPKNREYMEWVFGVSPGAPLESLPEDTTLRRRAKALMLSGGDIGLARGVLIE